MNDCSKPPRQLVALYGESDVKPSPEREREGRRGRGDGGEREGARVDGWWWSVVTDDTLWRNVKQCGRASGRVDVEVVGASIGLGVCWVVEGVGGVEDRVVSVHDDLS